MWLEDLDPAKKTVGDCTEPLTADNSVREMPALDCVRLFAKTGRPYYYVVEDGRLIGAITYASVFKLPFRLCLFALTLEIEELILRILLLTPERAWASLPRERQEKATAVFQRRHHHPPDPARPPFEELLESTMFGDKLRVLDRLGYLPPHERGKVRAVLTLADRVRNMCAHPDLDGRGRMVLNQTRLGAFVQDASRVLTVMRAVYASRV